MEIAYTEKKMFLGLWGTGSREIESANVVKVGGSYA